MKHNKFADPTLMNPPQALNRAVTQAQSSEQQQPHPVETVAEEDVSQTCFTDMNCSQTCFRTLRWGHQSENSLPGHAECLANKNIFRQKFNERAKILKIVGFWLFPECKTLYSRTLNHCLLTTLTSVFSQYQKHRSLL